MLQPYVTSYLLLLKRFFDRRKSSLMKRFCINTEQTLEQIKTSIANKVFKRLF